MTGSAGSSATIDVVIYDVWNEVGHYFITVTGTPPATGGSDGGTTSGGTSSGGGTTAVADPPTEQIPSGPLPQVALPAASPVDKPTAVRFLEHATFGPTPADVAAVMADGPNRWLAKQFNLQPTAIPTGLDTGHIAGKMFVNMANAPDQLRQRMMFALS